MNRSFGYDAENRQVTSTINGQSGSYVYDADGRRVQKVTPAGTTTFIYDAAGQLAAEYSTAAATDSGTSYLTADALGSTRVITDVSGAVKRSYDYTPFGEELLAGYAGRTVGMGFNDGVSVGVADKADVKYTGKERDWETGLDYFGARYFSGAQGRFTGADRINLTNARLLSPSNTLNKYVYAANNPLKFTDRDGQDITLFYRAATAGQIDFGHVFVDVLNQATGKTGFLDFYPTRASAVAPGDVNRGTFSEREGKYASITIQTTPEVAEKALKLIEQFKSNVPEYNLFSQSCVTACRAVLELAGINAFEIDPGGLYSNLYQRYSQDALNQGLGQKLLSGSLFSAPLVPKYAPGQEFGNPRNFGQGNNYQGFLFNLYRNQLSQQQPRACVEVMDSATGIRSKTCE